MKKVEKKYRCVPFWAWNDTLDKDELVEQVEWMNKNGVGGFFMHARGGLKTEYLGKRWFECIDACAKRAKELGMQAYAYDENGWPSGFAGGKLLEDIENHDRYLTHTYGEYDKNALASFEISASTLKKAREGDKNCLNIYEHYSTSTADILNPQVVDKFIKLTHEEYKKRDKHGIKGFFTDEPQFYRWGVPYTKVLSEYFLKEYNENILDRIGLLFVKKRGYRDFRYKFWKSMQSLMLNSFAKKIYEWCDENGYKLTGHYIEESYLAGQMNCCAGIMPFYEYEHIPGIDYLGTRITEELGAKQVDSVASQLGKEQILTETFAACGWNITPIELKTIAEAQYVAGVNLMCQHLLPYKEQGQRKRDYPAHFSGVNPWVEKGFTEFNDYFSYLGKKIATSKELVNVGVLHPIRSAYFDYEPLSTVPYNGLEYLERPFFALMEKMCHMGIGHHYLDETLLAKYGRVKGNQLILGKCSYDYIVLPYMLTMDKTTEALLRKYVENGGKILLSHKKPKYLEGKRYAYEYLKTNTSWKEISDAQPYKMLNNKNVRGAYRRDKQGREFIYAVNVGGEETTVDFRIKNGTSFKSYDIMKDEYKILPTRLHFDVGQSYLLYVSCEKAQAKKKLLPLKLKDSFKITGAVDNYMTLDMISYSLDGVSYTEPRHHMCVFSELLDKKYKGKVYLKYTAKVEKKPEICQLLCEDTNILEVTVNGERALMPTESGSYIAKLSYDIKDLIKIGTNEIVITVDYFQSEDVYYALFGENVTESLKNCLAYDTDIEAAYLKGSFGVYGSFEGGKREDVVLGEDFYIGEQRQDISSLIEDGYPFFRGSIELTQKIDITSTNYELVFPCRFHIADVTVNGKRAGRMMMSSRLDISKYLRKGENEIKLTLTVGNRNLLGPFHSYEEEPLFVGPDTFERIGTWQNGKSPRFNPKYSFVKTIL